MMWSKPNKNGEWDTFVDGSTNNLWDDSYYNTDGGIELDGIVVKEDHSESNDAFRLIVYAERGYVECEECGNCLTYIPNIVIDNPVDARLIELAPRMAETLISLVDNWRAMINRNASKYVRKTTLNLGKVDILVAELKKLKETSE